MSTEELNEIVKQNQKFELMSAWKLAAKCMVRDFERLGHHELAVMAVNLLRKITEESVDLEYRKV